MSDSAMLAAAEAEVQRLEAELAKTDAYKKLQLAKQVVALYRASASEQHQDVLAGEQARHPSIGSHPRKIYTYTMQRAVRDTKTARVEGAAVAYLLKKRARATSGELLEAMKEAGIEITGAEPNKALSAYLSNSTALNNVREYGGYGLAEWGNGRGPDLLTESGA